MSSAKKPEVQRKRKAPAAAAAPPVSPSGLGTGKLIAQHSDPLVLSAQALAGGEKIAARLLEREKTVAQDLDAKHARRWFMDAHVYLDENGILVGSGTLPMLETRRIGDTWRAFQLCESWEYATRGVITWDAAMALIMARRPAPRDLVLVMAIANALGKAERLLDQKMATKAQNKKAADARQAENRAMKERLRGWYEEHMRTYRKVDDAVEAAIKREAIERSTAVTWIKEFRREMKAAGGSQRR